MFNFRPTTLPGFRVGPLEDDEPGFNVPNDGSTPPVLPGAPAVPTVVDNYPFGATSFSFRAPQSTGLNTFVLPGNGPPLPPGAGQMPPNPTAAAGALPLDPRGYGGAFNYARYVPDNPVDPADPVAEPPNPLQKTDFNPIGRPKRRQHNSRKHRWR